MHKNVGLTKHDDSLLKQVEEEVDNVMVDVPEEETEEEAKKLETLKQMQALAIDANFPEEEIKARSAIIHKMEQKVATRKTLLTSKISNSELAHERKFQTELQTLQEKLRKEEEGLVLTAKNQKVQKEEQEARHLREMENIESTFLQFAADGKERVVQVKAAITSLENVHKESMRQLEEGRLKTEGRIGSQSEEEPKEGMIRIDVRADMPLVSPAELNYDKIGQQMQALSGQGGLFCGASDQHLQALAKFFQTLMENTAVAPAMKAPVAKAVATIETNIAKQGATAPAPAKAKGPPPSTAPQGPSGSINSNQAIPKGPPPSPQHPSSQ